MSRHVYTYTAGEPALFVNAYLVECEDGVVAIDAGLLTSDARALRARLDALGKPLLGVFVTHGHPDHYNGLVELVGDLAAPVHATEPVRAYIAETAQAKRAQWQPTYGDEWPATTHHPDTVVADGEVVELGALRVRVHDLGPCESVSEAAFVVEADGAAPVAFVGDLFYRAHHAYNADGLSGAWLAALDRAPAVLGDAALLYPGHGAPAGLEALDDQRRYQLMLREAVRNLAGGADHLSDGAKEELTARMTAFLPGAPLAWLVGLSADPVAAELADDG